MMKFKNSSLKRVLVSLLCLVVVIVSVGCGSVTTKTGTEAGKVEEYTFPEGGIIKKETFEKLKGTVHTSIYPGSTDTISYVWTFNGADIDNPMDFNITITENNEMATQVQAATGSAQVYGFSYADNAAVPGKYNLRLNLTSKWDCESIELYHLNGTSLDKVGTVNKTESNDLTQVNFGLTVAQGQFYLVSSTRVADPESLLGTDTVYLTTEEQKQLKQNIVNQDSNYSGKTDAYQTQLDNIPEGQPGPVEPADVSIDEGTTKYCTLMVECTTALRSSYLSDEVRAVLPSDGVIYATAQVPYHPGEMVFDVLQRETRNNKIHFEYSFTPIYNSAYIEGINNLYEFDAGELSGWMYCVNGWYPNYGCSRYLVKEGDVIEWHYTCDLGADLGNSMY